MLLLEQGVAMELAHAQGKVLPEVASSYEEDYKFNSVKHATLRGTGEGAGAGAGIGGVGLGGG